MEQERLDSFHLREARQALRFHMRRGKQLRRGANEPRFVRHLARAKSDADFFVRDARLSGGSDGSKSRWYCLAPRSTAIFNNHSGRRSPAPLSRAKRMAKPDTWAVSPSLWASVGAEA